MKRRPERGRPDFPGSAAGRPTEYGNRIHVAGLALVRRHAGGGIPLHVFNRAEAFGRREIDVRHRHVVSKVDPLAMPPVPLGPGRDETRWMDRGFAAARLGRVRAGGSARAISVLETAV